MLVSVPGEPLGLALRVGGYCVGHAVIVGVQAQARVGVGLWYAPLSSRVGGGSPGLSVLIEPAPSSTL